MSTMAPVPVDDPLMISWEQYKLTEEFANSLKWAREGTEENAVGSLWALFEAGHRRARALADQACELAAPARVGGTTFGVGTSIDLVVSRAQREHDWHVNPPMPHVKMPEPNVVYVTVSGMTGTGKSALAGEIQILCNALQLPCIWKNAEHPSEQLGGSTVAALEQYKPRVIINEVNYSRVGPELTNEKAIVPSDSGVSKIWLYFLDEIEKTIYGPGMDDTARPDRQECLERAFVRAIAGDP
jgi:hypothetical protein